MKKKVLCSIIIMTFTLSVKAQIYTPAAIIQGTSGNNNIGIGTSNPSGKLSVLGGIHKLTLTGVDGTFDNLIKYGHKSDLESGTSFANRWHGIDATITAGSPDANKLKFRLYAGGSGNAEPIDVMTLQGNGNVGIGTTAPKAKLTVNAGQENQANPRKAISILGPNEPIGTNSSQDLSWDFTSAGSSSIRSYRGGSWDTYLQFLTNSYIGGNAPQVRMHIDSQGNVGIGTTIPDAKLAVNGDIHATEVRVTSTVPVPDYVFAPDYKLRSLKEVENYIKENSHLPEIPSAQEIEKNGLMLAEMNMSLLKKMEEMTLYMIDFKKEIDVLKEENRIQKEEIKILKETKKL